MNQVLRTVTSLALATLAGTAGVLVAAGPAQASDAVNGAVVTRALAADEALDRAKAEVSRRIDLRLAALRRYGAAVNYARHLTDAHEATLDALIAEDAAGLIALRRKVAGETTLAALRADAASMVNDYRIFILVRPKVRLTIAGDAEQAVIRRLTAAHSTLTDLVARAKAAGKDTAGAEQDLADMQAALDRAERAIAGQVETLLAIEPGPDGDAIKAKVAAVRRALGTGRAHLRTALAEAHAVRRFLRSLNP
jgi:hypothetical protein